MFFLIKKSCAFKNVVSLEELASNAQVDVQRFAEAFKTFNEVVGSCYGKELHPDYKEKNKTISA